MRHLWFTLLAVVMSFMTSCGGGSPSMLQTAGDVSGNWQMSLTRGNSKKATGSLSGFLLQDTQGSITGNVIVTAAPCSGVGVASGSVTEPNVALTITPAGSTINLTGTIGSTPPSMSGQYTILYSGCSGTSVKPQSGTWSANLVPPFTGNITGTFDSTKFGNTMQISGQVNQAQNSGGSYAALTGNLAITGSSCFTSATISGQISGTAVVINFASSNGMQIGQITGAASTTSGTTQLTGKYNIVPQNGPAETPCREGDSGSVSFTL